MPVGSGSLGDTDSSRGELGEALADYYSVRFLSIERLASPIHRAAKFFLATQRALTTEESLSPSGRRRQ
jgi:hypothetical protein